MYIASLPEGVQNEFYAPTRLERMSTTYGVKGLTPQYLKHLRSQGVNLSHMYKQFRRSTPNIDPLQWIKSTYLSKYNPGIVLAI
jgi:hypothetical protein